MQKLLLFLLRNVSSPHCFLPVEGATTFDVTKGVPYVFAMEICTNGTRRIDSPRPAMSAHFDF